MSILTVPSKIVDEVDSEINPRAYVLITLLFEKQESNPKIVWRYWIGQELSRLRMKPVYCMIFIVQRNRFKQFLSTESVSYGHMSSVRESEIMANEGACSQ